MILLQGAMAAGLFASQILKLLFFVAVPILTIVMVIKSSDSMKISSGKNVSGWPLFGLVIEKLMYSIGVTLLLALFAFIILSLVSID